MPHITEEIWHTLRERVEGDYVIVAPWPQADVATNRREADETLLDSGRIVLEAVTQLRNVRNQRQIAQKQALTLFIKTDTPVVYQQFDHVLRKLANLSAVDFVEEKVDGAAGFIINTPQGHPDEFFVPLGDAIDVEAEREKLEKEQQYYQGFLKSVEKKLSNERFVNNAPKAVVDIERKKKSDAEAKLVAIEEQLRGLEG